jgi:uncharacterized protein (DUF934 family)
MHLLLAPSAAAAAEPTTPSPGVLRIQPHQDALAALAAYQASTAAGAPPLQRIDLVLPRFTDGRAYSQAVALRRRGHWQGPLRATGDVLVDQIEALWRTGFDEAELRHDQSLAVARDVLNRFPGFYQGDTRLPLPRFRTERAQEEAHP